jgi:formylglycine-generating enzyme required for sulfatase activity
VREKFFSGASCTDPNNPNDIMVKVGPLCVDKYEASVWSVYDGTGTQYGAGSDDYPESFPDTGKWTAPLYAVSKAGVTPSRFLTWFQAEQACALSGKRLLTNQAWQRAAAGTPDPGLAGDAISTSCNTNTSGPVNTGSRSGCVSNWDVHDMVGNAWEWVANWMQGPNGNGVAGAWDPDTIFRSTTTYGRDLTYAINEAATESDAFPAALQRGGAWDDGTDAGVFALSAGFGPSHSSEDVGFRCAR